MKYLKDLGWGRQIKKTKFKKSSWQKHSYYKRDDVQFPVVDFTWLSDMFQDLHRTLFAFPN